MIIKATFHCNSHNIAVIEFWSSTVERVKTGQIFGGVGGSLFFSNLGPFFCLALPSSVSIFYFPLLLQAAQQPALPNFHFGRRRRRRCAQRRRRQSRNSPCAQSSADSLKKSHTHITLQTYQKRLQIHCDIKASWRLKTQNCVQTSTSCNMVSFKLFAEIQTQHTQKTLEGFLHLKCTLEHVFSFAGFKTHTFPWFGSCKASIGILQPANDLASIW